MRVILVPPARRGLPRRPGLVAHLAFSPDREGVSPWPEDSIGMDLLVGQLGAASR
jgi:hypothetical protein